MDTRRDPNSLDETHLFNAAFRGDLTLAATLLANGTNVNAQDCFFNESTLLHAVKGRQIDMTRMLCKKGADVSLRNFDKKNALIEGIFSGCGNDIISILIEHGAEFDNELLAHAYEGNPSVLDQIKEGKQTSDQVNHNLLHYLIAGGHLELVKKAIDYIHPSETNSLQQTAIHIAAACNQVEIMDFFISRNENLSQKDKDQNSVFLTACYHGHLGVAQCLLQTNPQLIHDTGHDKMNALHTACNGDHLEMIIWLIQSQKINPLSKTTFDASPLHFAAMRGLSNVIMWLMENTELKTSLVDVDRDHASPMQYILQSGNRNLILYLLRNQYIKLDTLISNNMTVFHRIVELGFCDLVKTITQEFNVDLCQRSRGGLTLLHMTSSVELIAWLLDEKHLNPFMPSKLELYANEDYKGQAPLIHHLNRSLSVIYTAPVRKKICETVQYLLERGSGIKQKFSEENDLAHFNLENCVLIGATKKGNEPLRIKGAIHTIDELKEAIEAGILLNIPALLSTISLRLQDYPDDEELKDTYNFLSKYPTMMNTYHLSSTETNALLIKGVKGWILNGFKPIQCINGPLPADIYCLIGLWCMPISCKESFKNIFIAVHQYIFDEITKSNKANPNSLFYSAEYKKAKENYDRSLEYAKKF